MNSTPYSHIKAGVRPDIHPTIRFRSAWEANVARYLRSLVESGSIQGWEHEPKTYWFDKIKRGARSYLPDFRVTRPDGTQYYLECKGWMDARSQTKLKRMAKYHPTVEVQLIDEKAYRALEKEIGATIPGWEFRVRKPKQEPQISPT